MGGTERRSGVAPTGPSPDRWSVYLNVQGDKSSVRGKITVWSYSGKHPAGHEEVVVLTLDPEDVPRPVDAIPVFYALLGAWERRVSDKLKRDR